MEPLRKELSSFLGNEQHIDFKEVCEFVNQNNIHHLNSTDFLFPPGSQKSPSLQVQKDSHLPFCLFKFMGFISKEQL